MSIAIECFYRLLPKLNAVCEDEPDYHYSTYQTFVLETRLYPLIYNLIPNKNLHLYLKGIHNESRNKIVMHLQIEELIDSENPYYYTEPINVDNNILKIIKDKIAEITSEYTNYALIDVNELYKSSSKEYSLSYMKNMLQYVGLNSSYNPFIQDEGIYLAFNPLANYNGAYNEVCEYVLEKIDEFYHNGVVVLNDVIDDQTKEEFIKNWDLSRLDEETEVGRLYEPNWIDDRFAENQVDFLLNKISGDPYIRFKVSDNLVERHFIASELQKNNIQMIYESSYLKVVANNIEDSLKIAAMVTSATALAKGRVFTIYTSRLSYIHLYLDYGIKKYGNVNIVSYAINNHETPYIFSILLPNNEYSSYSMLLQEFNEYAIERLVEVSKISKLKNMSPHTIIEMEMGK